MVSLQGVTHFKKIQTKGVINSQKNKQILKVTRDIFKSMIHKINRSLSRTKVYL